MKIEIAGFGKMSQTGSSLLKLIQNNHLPVLDLLVREAIQNSLDAALSDSKFKSVQVDIGLNEINVKSLTKHFEGIEDILNNRFASTKQQALYIADTNTVGLTGHLNYKEVSSKEAGHIYKLIYGINMPQTKEGAGGSWGLGKTVYFRLGIGLVIYYSRIQKEDKTFEHRLAATLVEDEESPNAILPKEQNWNRGIAWWGQSLDGDSTMPLTNEKEIFEILHALNIEPFKGEATGTKIIIPFIDKNKILINPVDRSKLWWEESVEEYIKIAIQRWYAPRLDNATYPYGKWLDARVNGQRVIYDDMQRFFQEIQLLYNASSRALPSEKISLLEKYNIFVKKINLQRTFQQVPKGEANAGMVAFKKYTKKDLNMLPPSNSPCPFSLIGKVNLGESSNSPIVTYVRKPGMLINYELTGEWCNGVEVNSDEFLLAIFVPRSDTKLLSNSEVENLEEYLRKSEEADHASWFNIQIDNKETTIVSRIQGYVRKALIESYKNEEEKKVGTPTTMLAKKFGKILLPTTGFGKRAGGAVTPKGKEKDFPTSLTRNILNILDQSYNNNGHLNLNFLLKLDTKVNYATLNLIVISESGQISSQEWEDQKDGIGTAFPISLESLTINKINGEKTEAHIGTQRNKLGSCELNIEASNIYSIPSSIAISKDKEELILEGSLTVNIHDPFVQCSITLKTGEVKS